MSASDSGELPVLKTAKDVINFWYGDQERLANDPEYRKERGAKWWSLGEPDPVFINTQVASEGLITDAASDKLGGEDWEGPMGGLARILVLDQFPRTVYRGTSKAFATDELAASLSMELISKGWDTEISTYLKPFLYLPLMHSEKLDAQNMGVQKFDDMVAAAEAEGRSAVEFKMSASMARDHRAVIQQFGRFPHRNGALGRESTAIEKEWLARDDIPNWAASQNVEVKK